MKKKIEASGAGQLIVAGSIRLSLAEEKALNIMLRKAGGEYDGMAQYKIGWAMEDNFSSPMYDGTFKYDPKKKVPICFHPSQASYHLLSWEPPSATLFALEKDLPGEDLDHGTYNCLFHFVDPKSNEPVRPTIQVLEVIIPVMRQLHEIAIAARMGFNATRDQLREKKVSAIKDRQAKQDQEYVNYADSLLESSAPAFEGNPTSFPGQKGHSFSDNLPGERRIVMTDSDTPAPPPPEPSSQPSEFSFSVRSRK